MKFRPFTFEYPNLADDSLNAPNISAAAPFAKTVDSDLPPHILLVFHLQEPFDAQSSHLS